jgi:hypothetical protein
LDWADFSVVAPKGEEAAGGEEEQEEKARK